MNINDYLAVPYIDGGRDRSIGLDCWGLVRDVLHKVYSGPLLSEFGSVLPRQVNEMTDKFVETVPSFQKCKPNAGALACCFHVTPLCEFDIFHHVGICISEHEILHTSSKKGPQVLPLRAFKRLAHKTEFYEYVS